MSTKSVSEELEELLNNLNDEELAKLNADEINELRKKLNPYGRTIQGSNNYLNFSITLIRDEYLKKLYTTAMIGFLFRMCDEWKVPPGVPVTTVEEYLEDNSKINTPDMIKNGADKNAIADYEFNQKWMEKRLHVYEFLEEMFQFNPDEHVRSAYRPNRKDKNRKPVETPAGKIAVEHLKKTDKEFAINESEYEINNKDKLAKYKKITIKGRDGKVKTILRKETDENNTSNSNNVSNDGVENTNTNVNNNTNTNTNNANANNANANNANANNANANNANANNANANNANVNNANVNNANVNNANVNSENKEYDSNCSKTVRSIIPSHDTFGRYTRYLKENYEQLRDAVKDLYCEKPEYELAINPYSWHETSDDAEAFKKKHAKEVIAEVFTAHSGKWNFFDNFKEQRENVNFYTEDTIILEEMVKQIERDEKLGRDLMEKRKTIAKKKNIIENGPHAESFSAWKNNNPFAQQFQKTDNQKSDEEIMDEDVIQLDVWKIAKGGLELTKDKFYTQAEAPTFASEESVRDSINKANTQNNSSN